MKAKGEEIMECDVFLPEDGIYLPFEVKTLVTERRSRKRRSGVKLAVYAMACVESALKYSKEAQPIYAKIVQSWELPGCQALIDEMAQPKEDFNTWLCSLDDAMNGDKPLFDWPTAWTDAFETAGDNVDFCTLFNDACKFVLVSFNRKEDLDNRKPKVLPFAPGEDPYLAMAVVVYSLIDQLAKHRYWEYWDGQSKHIRLVRGPRAWSEESLIGYGRFCCNIPAGRATTRKERESGQARRQTLHREGYKLKHQSKIQKHADAWYKCRVSPGTIEAYVDELAKEDIYLDRSNIETAIAPYDEATGYPRKASDEKKIERKIKSIILGHKKQEQKNLSIK